MADGDRTTVPSAKLRKLFLASIPELKHQATSLGCSFTDTSSPEDLRGAIFDALQSEHSLADSFAKLSFTPGELSASFNKVNATLCGRGHHEDHLPSFDSLKISLHSSGIITGPRYLKEIENTVIARCEGEFDELLEMLKLFVMRLTNDSTSLDDDAPPELKRKVSAIPPRYKVTGAPEATTFRSILEAFGMPDLSVQYLCEAVSRLNPSTGRAFYNSVTCNEITYGRGTCAALMLLFDNDPLDKLHDEQRALSQDAVFPFVALYDTAVPETAKRGKQKRSDVLFLEIGCEDNGLGNSSFLVEEKLVVGSNRDSETSLSHYRDNKSDRVKQGRIARDVVSHSIYFCDVAMFNGSDVLPPFLPVAQIFKDGGIFFDVNFCIGEDLIYQATRYRPSITAVDKVATMLLARVAMSSQYRHRAAQHRIGLQAKAEHSSKVLLRSVSAITSTRTHSPSPGTPAKITSKAKTAPKGRTGNNAALDIAEIAPDAIAADYVFRRALTQRDDVFEGTRLSDGEEVILKVIAPSHPLELAMTRKAQQLPGVVRLLNVFVDSDGHAVMVLERLHPIPDDLTLDVLTRLLGELALTVHGLAGLDIVHNDIHDYNVLYMPAPAGSGGDGVLKLIDFGHSVPCGHPTWWKPLVGEFGDPGQASGGFCPPERADVEESPALPSTDLYAFGILIARLAVLRRWDPQEKNWYPSWVRFSSGVVGSTHPLVKAASVLTQANPDDRWTIFEIGSFLPNCTD